MIPLIAVVAVVQVSATTRPADDPAKRLAIELREYLKEARVESVEFRLNGETGPQLQLSERDEIAGVVKSFVEALAADDLQEGKQWHSPTWNVRICFVVADGPDVRELCWFRHVLGNQERRGAGVEADLGEPAIAGADPVLR